MTDQTGTLRAFDPEHIFANPYQHHSARRFRGEEFDALVEDIRVNGIHQPPPARPHPENANNVQLQMGHRRFAAWRVARPGEPFTVIEKPLTDLEMLDGVIEENIHRTDLNDIERAQMIETYKQVRPDATNADMARVFRLKDPASITNIRKLLHLPKEIQTLVAEDKLPDAYARQLVGISKVNPKAAQKIAAEVAAASKSDKQDVFENQTRELFWRNGVNLDREYWSMDWLANAPVTVERDLGEGDHLVGACAGCVFNVSDRCMRKPCFEEKYKLWAAQEVARVAAKLKLPAVAPDEKTFPLFSGQYGDDDRARDLLNARKEIRATLRIAACDDRDNYYLRHTLNSRAVTLVTTDKNAVDAYFAERNAAAKSTLTKVSVDKDEESDAERAKRIERERKEMEAKRAARSKMWKSYYDAKWLLESASRQIGAELAKRHTGAFVPFIEEQFCEYYGAGGAASTIEDHLEGAINVSKDPEPLRLAHVALCVIASTTRDSNYHIAENEHEFRFERVRNFIQQICSAKGTHTHRTMDDFTFGVTLPDGWDVPPIHHTSFNCWHCGVFAGNMQEKLTQRDIHEDGWIDDGKDGVFDSLEHKTAYFAAAQHEEQHAKTKATHKAKAKRAAQKIAKPASASKRGRPKKK